MAGIKWSSFFVVSSIAKTVVHFMPIAKIANAPYPVNCKFEVFGVGFPKKAVLVDGARLQQPDGLRVLDLVPELKNSFSGMLGFSLELNVAQAHVDLQDSLCFVELVSGKDSVRFSPQAIPNNGEVSSQKIVLAATRNMSHSIIFINSGLLMQPLQVLMPNGNSYKLNSMNGINFSSMPTFASTTSSSELSVSANTNNIPLSLSPWSVAEFSLNETELSQLNHTLRYSKITAAELLFEANSDLSAYLVTRDSISKKIISVRTL